MWELIKQKTDLRAESQTDLQANLQATLRKKNARKGFTLIEVIVVLVILAILAAIAIPALTGYIDKADQRAVISQAATVRTALQAIASDSYSAGGSSLDDTYSGSTNLNSGPEPATPAADTIYGYNPVSGAAPSAGNPKTSTIAAEVTALNGSTTIAPADLTGIEYDGRTLTNFEIKISGKTVTFDSGNYTVSTP
ncbi:MAG: prepilin-type N-terminal cleavage/methylation domain-containing protein [Coriobacteriales bacterium]|jgi:type IV pilus assembly protein PilA|nr:prepilin-type N-terminal cleavage/methylation domain-containing protein [Coriobacteriales bacterium]